MKYLLKRTGALWAPLIHFFSKFELLVVCSLLPVIRPNYWKRNNDSSFVTTTTFLAFTLLKDIIQSVSHFLWIVQLVLQHYRFPKFVESCHPQLFVISLCTQYEIKTKKYTVFFRVYYSSSHIFESVRTSSFSMKKHLEAVISNIPFLTVPGEISFVHLPEVHIETVMNYII